MNALLRRLGRWNVKARTGSLVLARTRRCRRAVLPYPGEEDA